MMVKLLLKWVSFAFTWVSFALLISAVWVREDIFFAVFFGFLFALSLHFPKLISQQVTRWGRFPDE